MLHSMKHLFHEARFEDGWLCLRVDNRSMARQFIFQMQPGRVYDAELKLHCEARSLDANAYFWVLVGKLAAALHIPKSEIYQEYVREIGDNFEILPIRTCAVNRFIDGWKHNGIGWICDRTGSSKLPGYENILAYYGSSTYNTEQMARLIDLAVQDCREQGIETATPEELARLKEEWNHE